VANVTIATSSKYKDKHGELVTETEWHRVTFFGRLAEIAAEYLKKGRPVYVEGRIKTTKYTDKDGQDKFSTGIIANEIQLLGDRGHGDSQDGQQQPEQSRGAQPQRQAPERQPAPAPRAPSGFDDMDDDIPFRDPMACRAFCLVV